MNIIYLKIFFPYFSLLKKVLKFIFFTLFLLPSLAINAAQIAEKTPADVYAQVQLLSQDVHALRVKNKIQSLWPKVAPEQGRAPHHVFQKTLEILDKINRYRINVIKTGGITVPRFPGRDITPNEVYSVVVRLRQELDLLVTGDKKSTDTSSVITVDVVADVTPDIVYAALSEISIALDETLGIRGITPSEVYIRSEQVLQLAIFLRYSQNLPMNIQKPERANGQLPNHALQHVNQLLNKIKQSEKNLWMKPIEVSVVPRRVISPGDVYDSMGLALAELQRIQFRLGLERSFETPTLKESKTPDDVIQNVDFAIRLLPDFKIENPLQQYDRNTLVKTPNQVYSITENILEELRQYRRLRGIQVRPGKAVLIQGLQSQHVYGKTLEIIEKINLIRQAQNIGAITEPHYPLRKITPAEVFNEALRVDEELTILYQYSGMTNQLWITKTDVKEYDDKTPSDVFFNMQRISLLLDTILGTDVFTPNYVYREAQRIQQEILILAQRFGETIPQSVWQNIEMIPSTQPENVLPQVKKLLELVLDVQRRAGMFQVQEFSVPPGDVITPTEIYNLIRVVASEITELKVFLGINQTHYFQPKVKDKTSGHVMQLIQGNQAALELILHKNRPVQ